MTIRSVQINEGLVVVVRRGFEQLTDANGVPQADRDGQPVYAAEVVIPGRLISRFADNDQPDLVRLRVVGHNPGHNAGDVVRLGGKVLLTAWYTPRARGSNARSDVTISAERVEAARGSAPSITGGLECSLPAGMFLGQDGEGVASLMLPPEGVHTVDGLAAIKVASPVPVELVGADVVPVGLRAFFVAPDREDVSQRAKAELILTAVGLERVGATNGRTRKSDPPAEAAEVNAGA